MSDPILELLATPPNPPMSVDEHSVHAGGRRRLRRRALRRTGFGVMGVVGAAAIAFGALGTGVGTDALPSGPSPSVSSSGRVSVELLDGRYAVEVLPNAGRDEPNVISYSVKDGKRQQLAGSSATANVVSMGTGSGAEGVMLGTAPAEARQFLALTKTGTGGVAIDHADIPGTDFQAIALDFDDAQDIDGYVTTYWLGGGGEVRSADGTWLPSAAVPGGIERVFADRDNGQLGFISSEGGTLRPLSAPGPVTTSRLAPGGDMWRATATAVLPLDAVDVRFTWKGGSPGDVTVVRLSGVGVVGMNSASAPASAAAPGPQATAVTYTDAAGTRNTDAVE